MTIKGTDATWFLLRISDAIFLSEGFIFNKVEDGKVYLTDRKGNERIIHAHFKQQDLLQPLSLNAKNRQEDSLRVYLAKMNTEKWSFLLKKFALSFLLRK